MNSKSLMVMVLGGAMFIGSASVVLISIFGPDDINAKTQLIATIMSLLTPSVLVLLDLVKTSSLHGKLDDQTAQLEQKIHELSKKDAPPQDE